MSSVARASFLPDTSAIVPLLCPWHEHHQASLAEMERRLRRHERMFVAAPAIVEAYAVLTRLPAPYRVSAADAHAMLKAGFMPPQRVVALTTTGYLGMLQAATGVGVAGGRTYDAVIAACARQAEVTTLLTFNDSHFRPLLHEDIDVVVPTEDRR